MASDDLTLRFALDLVAGLQGCDLVSSRSNVRSASRGSTPRPATPSPSPRRAPARPTTATKGGSASPVFVSWAHSHASWDSTQEKNWQSEVVAFTATLRQFGIDAEVDLFHLDDPAVDWTRFGPKHAAAASAVLIVMSEAWAERWDGRNTSLEGAGAVAEADVLHGLFEDDQAEFQRRCFVVLLSGHARREIPLGLRRLPSYPVSADDPDSYGPLLRALTEKPQFVKPPLGELPTLPADVLNEHLDVQQQLEELRRRLETSEERSGLRPRAGGKHRGPSRSTLELDSMRQAALRGLIEVLLRGL
jgi:hypothetical protein